MEHFMLVPIRITCNVFCTRLSTESTIIGCCQKWNFWLGFFYSTMRTQQGLKALQSLQQQQHEHLQLVPNSVVVRHLHLHHYLSSMADYC
jgi:hypothetical protein